MKLPENVRVGPGTVITGDHAFKRFLSRSSPGLTIGEHCTMDGTHFAVGAEGRIQIGDYCYFTNAVLLCELELRIGSYVVIGWNATIADTDFHPIAPADRIADAIACSPLAAGRPRPPIARRAVVIEDDVWIGPLCTIDAGTLSPTRIRRGAKIDAQVHVGHNADIADRLGRLLRLLEELPSSRGWA